MKRMNELIEILTKANEAYEQGVSQLSDFEYDKLYDELMMLELQSGKTLENSPTLHVGHKIVSTLQKVRHSTPLLSLDKTKEIAKLQTFLMAGGGLLSWKLDGLTVVLKYSDGKLLQALTRGNGEIGEDVTHNANFFRNIPKKIAYTGELSVRGEAVISFEEFERINDEIDGEKYKNPRNLCAGTIRQLNSRAAALRNVDFFAFAVLDGGDFEKKSQSLEFLMENGFSLVQYTAVTEKNVEQAVLNFKNSVDIMGFATDGLVLTYDDIEFSESLGATSKFPRDSIAFKWADELVKTRLIGIEWNTSRTGLINPIAVFEAVDIEGSSVERASLHNLSIVESLELGVGDEISVYKANMIIPQIAENFTKSGFTGHPSTCPVCAEQTHVKDENGVKTLYCTNPNCKARVVRTIKHYAGRDALNIDGFSGQTIEKFIELGFLDNFSDIYNLNQFAEQIIALRGFGKRSYDNLIASIEQSKNATLASFIFGLGIDNVGLAGAKALCKYFSNDFNEIRNATPQEIVEIDGFGEVIATSIYEYFNNAKNNDIVDKALAHLKFASPAQTQSNHFEGLTFVITGDLAYFKNRKELAEQIEEGGGKVAGSVSKNTDFLINNDTASGSSKNKKADELGVKIISEEEFVQTWIKKKD